MRMNGLINKKGAATFDAVLVMAILSLILFFSTIESGRKVATKTNNDRLQALIIANNVLSYCEQLHHSLFKRGEDIVIAKGQWSKERSKLFSHTVTPKVIGPLEQWVSERKVTLKLFSTEIPMSQNGNIGLLKVYVTVEWSQEGRRERLSLPRCIQVVQ